MQYFKTIIIILCLILPTYSKPLYDFNALANSHAQQYPFENQLFNAIAHGDYDSAYNFITYTRINPRSCNDFALICAAHFGHTPLIRLLLDRGLYINAQHGAPLCEASRNGHYNAVECLLRKGANVHESNDYALACAAWNGHSAITKLLLDWNASIHADNDAALRWASLNGHYATVEILLRRGANPRANNHEALYNARRNGHFSIARMIEGFETYGNFYFWL